MSHTRLPWSRLLLLASVCCLAMISELLPSSFIQEMASDFQVELGSMSLFIGCYAIMSALIGIPLTRVFSHVNRKHYLMAVCLAYSLSNLAIGLASNFIFAFAARLVAGAVAGALWAMIASYPIRFLPEEVAGRGTAIVLAGVTVGLSLGLPLATSLAKMLDWRAGFFLVAGLYAAVTVIGYFGFPSVAGEAYTAENNYSQLLKDHGTRVVCVLTLLLVGAQYLSYIFIQLLAEHNLMSVNTVQFAFGIGALASIGIVARVIDRHLIRLGLSIMGISIIALLLISGANLAPWSQGLAYLGFILWGLSFTPVTTVLQTLATRRTQTGKSLANSLNATCYDLAIMLSSLLGSFLIQRTGLLAVTGSSIVLIICALILLFHSRHYWSSPS